MQLLSFMKAFYILKKHYDSDHIEQRNQWLQSSLLLEHLLCFASPSDGKGSQKMKPSVMAHFQAFMDRSVAGHWVTLREKAGHPQLLAVTAGQLGPAGLRCAGETTHCPGWALLRLQLLRGTGTGQRQPPNDVVHPHLPSTSFPEKVEKRGWKRSQGSFSPALSLQVGLTLPKLFLTDVCTTWPKAPLVIEDLSFLHAIFFWGYLPLLQWFYPND